MMENIQQRPLQIVGSNKFGRYPKISAQQYFNMMQSDGWMVPTPGYEVVATLVQGGQQGRGIYFSSKYQHLIAVVDNAVRAVDANNAVAEIGNLETFVGDVYIAENNANQIAITDKKNIYIFNYVANTFQIATIDFEPAYIAFQDGYFIAAASIDAAGNTNTWRLSDPNNGLSWPDAAPNDGLIETKPDVSMAAVPYPGRGSLLVVFGKTVGQLWEDTGQQLFPYELTTYFNIDYGCLNAATIAALDGILIWLGSNEKAGVSIMYTTGGQPQQISTDGINFKLAQLTNPSNAYGFLFKQDGHLLYQITFPDDGLTYLYDFNVDAFYTLTDEYMSYHIAKRVAYFNNTYYFVSFDDGYLYKLSNQINTYNGNEIPRVMVLAPLRLPDSSTFITQEINFLIEQGDTNDVQRVDTSISVDGAESFGSYFSQTLNALGHRKNIFRIYDMGMANDLTIQFRLWSKSRFVVGNGTWNYYQ